MTRPCAKCRKPFPAREMVEARLELRTLDARQDRFAVVKLLELCRTCGSATAARLRGLSDEEQLDLWDQSPARVIEELAI